MLVCKECLKRFTECAAAMQQRTNPPYPHAVELGIICDNGMTLYIPELFGSIQGVLGDIVST